MNMLTQLQSAEVVPKCTACAMDSATFLTALSVHCQRGGKEGRGGEERRGILFQEEREGGGTEGGEGEGSS